MNHKIKISENNSALPYKDWWFKYVGHSLDQVKLLINLICYCLCCFPQFTSFQICWPIFPSLSPISSKWHLNILDKILSWTELEVLWIKPRTFTLQRISSNPWIMVLQIIWLTTTTPTFSETHVCTQWKPTGIGPCQLTPPPPCR